MIFFRTGKLLLFMALFGLVIWWVIAGRVDGEKIAGNALQLERQGLAAVGAVTTFGNPIAPMATETRVNQRREEIKPARSAALYVDPQARVSDEFAPFGRLLECQLVVTLDSSRAQTPIVGQVTRDVWHNGRLIIPAGAEVHGMAQADRSRDRITAQDKWVLVWRLPRHPLNGCELPLTGVALAYLPDADGRGWNIIDGSAGLPGEVIKTDKWAEIKLFAATFIQGIGQGLGSSEMLYAANGVYQSSAGTIKNSLAKGAELMTQSYAQQIQQAIQRDGFFVRVAAGTPFYLYVTQTIDLADAGVGVAGANNQRRNQK
ncbi:MAG: TrbI/VirB10 family protein [Verrucomicrobiales bacterium]|nr:TrbI/VirB10 family protein [Verrucomicrobiales bacterium]